MRGPASLTGMAAHVAGAFPQRSVSRYESPERLGEPRRGFICRNGGLVQHRDLKETKARVRNRLWRAHPDSEFLSFRGCWSRYPY
jgi:hypothetical protein